MSLTKDEQILRLKKQNATLKRKITKLEDDLGRSRQIVRDYEIEERYSRTVTKLLPL